MSSEVSWVVQKLFVYEDYFGVLTLNMDSSTAKVSQSVDVIGNFSFRPENCTGWVSQLEGRTVHYEKLHVAQGVPDAAASKLLRKMQNEIDKLTSSEARRSPE